MKTFCANCGHSMEYAHTKPNFCTSCGTKMDGGTAAVSPSPRPVSRPPQQRNNYIELDYDANDIDLDSVSIVAEAKHGVKLGEVIGQGGSGWVNRKGMSKAEIKKYNERMTTLIKTDVDDKGKA